MQSNKGTANQYDILILVSNEHWRAFSVVGISNLRWHMNAIVRACTAVLVAKNAFQQIQHSKLFCTLQMLRGMWKYFVLLSFDCTRYRECSLSEKRLMTHKCLSFFLSLMQRNQLFHSFSMSAMCKAGIQVLDVYPLSAAFYQGTLDYVHYNDTVFYPAANVIQNYVIESRRRRQENTRGE